MNWQPIDTAPTDGKHVLVVDQGMVSEARHLEDRGWWLAGEYPADVHSQQLYPTHWMPLPAPPSATGDENGPVR